MTTLKNKVADLQNCKARHVDRRRHLLRFVAGAVFALSAGSLPVAASAQSIDVSPLSSAQAFDPGPLNAQNGGLSPNLWNGTSARHAARLMKDIPAGTPGDSAAALYRAALLTGGVPPKADTDAELKAYQQARMNAILSLGDLVAAQSILTASGGASKHPEAAAGLALLSGENETACSISDSIIDARAETDWVKLRGFCHAIRGESAAAELTADLLKSNDVDDPSYFELLGVLTDVPGKVKLKNIPADPLHIAMVAAAGRDWPTTPPAVLAARMAISPDLGDAARLSALYQADWALLNDEMQSVINDFAAVSEDETTPSGSDPKNFEAALKAKPPRALGLLYEIAKSGEDGERVKACAEILRRADEHGAFNRFAHFLKPELRTLSFQNIKLDDLTYLARAAVQGRDLAGLQNTYSALSEKPELQERIALAADALGNGFYAGSLGDDIEARLKSDDKPTKARALRDAYIAYALGATLSDVAIETMDGYKGKDTLSPKLFMLSTAARTRASGQAALRAGTILSTTKPSDMGDMRFAVLIKSLYDAGVQDYAGRLAAEDFLRGLGDGLAGARQ